MDDETKSSSARPAGNGGDEIRLITRGRCPDCRYNLRGLPEFGLCPECGRRYAPNEIDPLSQLPGVLEICLRFGWPIGALALGSLPIVLLDDPVPLLCVAFVVLLMTPVNTVVQVLLMQGRCAPLHHLSFAGALDVLGLTAIILFLLTIMAPFVAVAGCFYFL